MNSAYQDFLNDQVEDTRLPTHCPGGLHRLTWVIPGTVAICDGHATVVWVKAEENAYNIRLRCENGHTTRILADRLAKLIAPQEEPAVVEVAPLQVDAGESLPRVRNFPLLDSRKSRYNAQTQLVINIGTVPDVSRDDFINWYKGTGRTQRSTSDELGISRGLLSDIISGRRKLTEEVARRASIIMTTEKLNAS